MSAGKGKTGVEGAKPAGRAAAKTRARKNAAAAGDDVQMLLRSLHTCRQELEQQELRSRQELEAVRQRCDRLYESAPVGYVELDTKGYIRSVNATAAHMLGKDKRSLENSPLSDRLMRQDAELLDAHLRKVFGVPGAWSCELRLARKDKAVMNVELRSMVCDGPDGERCLTSMIDITPRKRAADAVRAGRKRLQMALAASRMGVWEWDPRTDALFWSPECFELLGAEGPVRTLRSFTDLLHPADADRVMSSARRAIADKSAFREEFRVVRPDGRHLWLVIIGHVEYDDAGAKQRFIGTIRDITESKLLQMEVAKQEQWLNSFFMGATAGLALLDRDLRYIRINDTLADMNGLPAAEHIGRTVREILPRIADAVEPVIHRVLATGQPVLKMEVSGETPHRPGIRRHWLESFFPVKDADGTPQGVGAIVVEVTGLKQAEEEVRSYRDALRSLTEEFSVVEERERHRIARDLHDQLGQTLAVANMRLGALRAGCGAAGAADVDDIRRLIGQVIEYTRSLTFELSPPVLYELGLVPGLSALAERFQARHGLEIHVRDDGRPKVMDDDRLIALYKAVRELLMNIVKHANARTAVVTLQRDADRVRITVEDDGVGFDTSGMKPYSTAGGFGLFSTQERLRGLGGSLTIVSAPGRGTNVSIEAPLQQEHGGTRHGDEDPYRRRP